MEKLFNLLDPAITVQIKESIKQYARSGSGIQFELLEVTEKQLSIKVEQSESYLPKCSKEELKAKAEEVFAITGFKLEVVV